MTSDLQQTRYDQLIRRVGGIIGPGSKVAEALTELFPTIDVENVPGELLWLSGWRLGFGGAVITGAVGEAARVQLFNPVGSGKIVSVSQALISTSGTSTIRISVTTTALASGIGTELQRDTRGGVIENTTSQIRTDSLVALADATIQYRTVANVLTVIKDKNSIAVLAPGTGITFGHGSAAALLSVSFFYRERVALESELLFP